MKKTDPTETDQVSRRAALGLGVTLGAVAIGCGSNDETVPPAETQQGTPPPTGETPPGNPPPVENPPASDPKLGPKELLAGIEHIVVLMMENRSFDHYLGALSSDAAYVNKATVAGLTG